MNYEMQGNYAPAADEGNPQNEYRWAMIAAGIGAVIIAIGMFIFAINAENREEYHGWYLLAFFVSTIGFSVAFGLKRFILAFLTLAIAGCVLAFSIMKFQYRSTLAFYASKPSSISLLGDYVQNLPPLETRIYSFSEIQKWVQFDKECYRPLMAKAENIPESCKSKADILNTYNINIISVLKDRYALMRTTAQQIEQKTIADKASYEACISGGTCAEVPMLPAEASAKVINSDSSEYKEIRNAFWAIIKSEQMDAASCEYIPLCKIMFDAGAVTRTDFDTLKTS